MTIKARSTDQFPRLRRIPPRLPIVRGIRVVVAEGYELNQDGRKQHPFQDLHSEGLTVLNVLTFNVEQPWRQDYL